MLMETDMLVWDQMIAELGPLPREPFTTQELEFDEAPWVKPPTEVLLGELGLWQPPPLDTLIHALAVKAHGDGEDLPRYMAHQRWLAEIELELSRGREVDSEQRAGAADDPGFAADATVAAAAAQRGGGGVEGEPEDGVAVVEDGQTPGGKDTGRSPKVPRRRGPRRTG